MDTFLKLKKQRRLRRIIEGAAALVSLAFLIAFSTLKENGKIVTRVEVTPFLSYDSVQYANDYSIAILISSLIFALFASALLADLLLARIYYKEISGEDVILYIGLGPVRLLVNGEERDAMFLKGYMETKLKSGVSMTVSPQFFMSYHLTFSDGRPAVDL